MKILSPIQNLQISQYLTKKNVLYFLAKVKILTSPAGSEFMTYRFVEIPLTQCTMLLGNSFGKETIYMLITFDCIVYFDK